MILNHSIDINTSMKIDVYSESDPIRNSCLSDCCAIIEGSFEMNIILLLWTFLISDMMHTLSECYESCHTFINMHMLSMESKQVGAMFVSISFVCTQLHEGKD